MSIFPKLRALFGGKKESSTPVEITGQGMNDQTGIDIVKWILGGKFNTYYRDSVYDEKAVEYYKQQYALLKADCDLTVSRLQQHPATTLRYVIYSGHVFNNYEVDGENDYFILSNRVCTIPRDSYFMVLDVYAYEKVTQVTLLHIPYQSVEFFMANGIPDIVINGQDFVGMARKNLVHCMSIKLDFDFKSEKLEDRTKQPIGFDDHGNALPLDYTYDVDAIESHKHDLIIHRDSNDLDPINYPADKADIINRLASKYKPSQSNGNKVNNARVDVIEQMLAFYRHLFPVEITYRNLVREMAETDLERIDLDCARKMLQTNQQQKWMAFAGNVRATCENNLSIDVEDINAIMKFCLEN